MSNQALRRVDTRAVLALVVVGCVVASASATTPTFASTIQPRTLYFANQCKYPVRLGATGGNTGLACGTTADCPAGTWCGGGFCFFTLPEPQGGFDMKPGESSHVRLNAPIRTQAGQEQVWSGAVFASTGCLDTPGCATAVCSNNGTCPPNVGPLGPRTLAEFTLQPQANDYYDVSIINGVNVPMSMQPLLAFGNVFGNGTNVDPAYYCATPGATSVPSGSKLAPCSWKFTPPTSVPTDDLLLVSRSATPTACTSDTDCSGDLRCGLQMDTSPNGGATPNLSKSCGTALGWWTADEVCAWTDAVPYGSPFNCAQQTSQGASLTMLYGCAGGVYGHSCYSNGASDSCCGCPTWPDLGVPAPSAKPCVNKNPVWAQYALPMAKFLKQGCPTAYSYPFDDMSSTFQCYAKPAASGPHNNTASYQITFCPWGSGSIL